MERSINYLPVWHKLCRLRRPSSGNHSNLRHLRNLSPCTLVDSQNLPANKNEQTGRVSSDLLRIRGICQGHTCQVPEDSSASTNENYTTSQWPLSQKRSNWWTLEQSRLYFHYWWIATLCQLFGMFHHLVISWASQNYKERIHADFGQTFKQNSKKAG